MSTSYISLKNSRLAALTVDDISRMVENGLEVSSSNKHHLSISVDGNFLWGYPNDNGEISQFERWGRNDVNDIIQRIEAATGIKMLSEHDDGYGQLVSGDN